jgi:ComF family protein
VRAAVIYEQLAKDLVWRLKFAHAQDAAREMAALMRPSVGHQQEIDFLIVPVPTATTRARQRGFDQARLVAQELARSVRQPYADVLARQNQAHQVGASREQRKQQLAGAFRVTKPWPIKHVRILLIDDVVTTGATLEAATAALRAVGARHIEALVFAQPSF